MKKKNTKDTCPNCGYCPTCGRMKAGWAPVYPAWPTYPIWINTSTGTTPNTWQIRTTNATGYFSTSAY
ncbi:MAG: hypothetical protein ACXWPI_00245, partial [Ktedonobacterales bacterium]